MTSIKSIVVFLPEMQDKQFLTVSATELSFIEIMRIHSRLEILFTYRINYNNNSVSIYSIVSCSINSSNKN